MKQISDLDVQGKRILLRASLNVPFNKKGEIADDFRLRSLVETIEDLTGRGAKVVIIGHLGRPQGRDEKLSLKPVADRLEEVLGKEIGFFEDCIGKEVQEKISLLKDGEIIVLENLRFHKGEEDNDPAFAKELSLLSDIYVNEAFDASHRAHASIVGVPAILPSAIGFCFAKEIEILENLLSNSAHPLVVIVGGSKVDTKSSFVDKISNATDIILVANLVANEIIQKKIKLSNPKKVILAPDGDLDIGDETIELFSSYIKTAKTILWAGPLGRVEEKKYQKGSSEIAKAVIASAAYSVIGGGDLVAFLGVVGYRDKFSHVSIGGGALMAYLSGDKLPGLEALK